jgi:hypothetical protein
MVAFGGKIVQKLPYVSMAYLLENLSEKIKFFKKIAENFRFAKNYSILGCKRKINIKSSAKKISFPQA